MTVDAPGYRSDVDTVDVMTPGIHDHIASLAGDTIVCVDVIDAESGAAIPGAAPAVQYVDRPVVADGLETDSRGGLTSQYRAGGQHMRLRGAPQDTP